MYDSSSWPALAGLFAFLESQPSPAALGVRLQAFHEESFITTLIPDVLVESLGATGRTGADVVALQTGEKFDAPAAANAIQSVEPPRPLASATVTLPPSGTTAAPIVSVGGGSIANVSSLLVPPPGADALREPVRCQPWPHRQWFD